MKTEYFKELEGFEGRYEISNFGRIWSRKRTGKGSHKTGRFLTPQMKPDGYWRILLMAPDGKQRSYLLHRLIAIAFVPNPLGLPEVNHADGKPANLDPDNLEWTDRPGNNDHALENGLKRRKHSPFWGVTFHPTGHRLRPWRATVRFEGKVRTIGYFATDGEAARAYDSFVVENKIDRPLNFKMAA